MPKRNQNTRNPGSSFNYKKPVGSNQSGFTLIELLIVITLLAILGAVSLPNFINQAEKARTNAANFSVKAAANGCAAMLISGSETDINEYNDSLGSNIISSGPCSDGVNYTSVGFAADGGNLSTQAVAVVDEVGVRLIQPAGQ